MVSLIFKLMMLFYGAALAGFLLTLACFTAKTRIRANLWILGAVFAIFALSWLRFAI